MELVVSGVHRARHRLRSRLSEYPALYLPFARRKYPGPSPQVLGPTTELVIDGYTRCASTFAVYAFQLSQDRPVRLAHHLHAPAQLVAAARRGVPALVLIREPRGAILSQLAREPDVALPDALVAYRRFYHRLLPYMDSLVVADFEEITRDFGAVVRRVNGRFGTSFQEFGANGVRVADCLDAIKQRDSLSETVLGFESGLVSLQEFRAACAGVGEAPPAAHAWIPSDERDEAKAALEKLWSQPHMGYLITRAQRMYKQFLASSRAGAPPRVAPQSPAGPNGQQPIAMEVSP
jgi:hypothetical protein